MVLRAPAALSVTILRPADAADLTLVIREESVTDVSALNDMG